MFSSFKQNYKKLRRAPGDLMRELDQIRFLQGQIGCLLVGQRDHIRSLADAELKVYSQWGEDGIIEWLTSGLVDIPHTFVEFGVETYHEANTRFLLENRNWSGLVLDGSPENIKLIKASPLSWKFGLTAVSAFIDASNVQSLLDAHLPSRELGILSIDIDGNDYWVWEAIDAYEPWIVIVEFNSGFGDSLPITIPYDPKFVRGTAHHSNLYYGASLCALIELGKRKGYVFAGTNTAGNNTFFVREDQAHLVLSKIDKKLAWRAKFREGRMSSGEIAALLGAEANFPVDLPVIDLASNRLLQLSELKGARTSIAWLEKGYAEF